MSATYRLPGCDRKGRKVMMPGFVNFMRRMLMLALFVSMFGALLAAQSTTDGAISGTVFDSNGAVIAKAQVVVRNNGTNAEQTVAPDDSGYYLVTKLQPGSNTLHCKHPSF